MPQCLVTVVRLPTKDEANKGEVEEVLLAPQWILADTPTNAKTLAIAAAGVVLGTNNRRVEARCIMTDSPTGSTWEASTVSISSR